MNIDEVGFYIKQVPVREVRCRYSEQKNDWLVEYRLENASFVFDYWWWYEDSIHSTFSDAERRTNLILANGYVEVLERKTLEHKIPKKAQQEQQNQQEDPIV